MIRSKLFILMLVSTFFVACGSGKEVSQSGEPDKKVITESETQNMRVVKTSAAARRETEADTAKEESTTAETAASETTVPSTQEETKSTEAVNNENNKIEIGLDPNWAYASFSKINSGKSVLYKAVGNAKGITIAVNAGHGTKGGSSQKTLCHPDGTPKVTGGTTKAGATTAIAVSEGMTFSDGTAESTVTFEMAKVLREELLSRGYNVLMIRDDKDVQLDNIARTVISNNNANAHIALHWDSTESDKGAFYMGVPDVGSYKAMEPVASHWQEHEALGKALIQGLSAKGVKIFGDGWMAMDLTQTSYSTIPSIDIELGDKKSDYGNDRLNTLSKGIADGIDSYFGF